MDPNNKTPLNQAQMPNQPQQPRLTNDLSWRMRFDKMFTRMELMGVKAANKLHRGFINCVLLFIFYNAYVFATNYNSYWRLRRDPNIPKQWLEEQEKPGGEDWKLERERSTRDERIIGRNRRE